MGLLQVGVYLQAAVGAYGQGPVSEPHLVEVGLNEVAAYRAFNLSGIKHQVCSDAAIKYVLNVQMSGHNAIEWPDLDVDLEIDSLKHPERYAAAAALSGAFIADWLQRDRPELYAADFGETTVFRGSAHDPFVWADTLAQSGQPKPTLFMAAGTDDWLYSQSVELHAHLEKLGFEVKWISAPGNHNWEFWDTHIQKVLDWLPSKQKP